MSNKTYDAVIKLMAAIIDVTGELVKTTEKVNGADVKRTEGWLTLRVGQEDKPSEIEEIRVSLDDFDNVYRGFVKAWPVVKPLKEKLIAARRVEISSEKDRIKADKIAAKKAEKEALKQERSAAREAAKKAKADAAAKLKKEKEEKAAKELAAKKKADAAKLKKAADAKAKRDAAAAASK